MPSRKYETPEQFDRAVDAYIEECREAGRPVTWTGLALGMGFAGRECLDMYKKYRGFKRSVQRAHTIVEYNYELRLHGNTPTGAIFALKNMGWRDDRGMDVTSKGDKVALPVVALPDNGRGDMLQGDLEDPSADGDEDPDEAPDGLHGEDLEGFGEEPGTFS